MDDGFQHRKVKAGYNIIITAYNDLFIDDKVPLQFYSPEFCEALSRIISKKGSVLFNIGINKTDIEARNKLVTYFKLNPEFNCELLEKIEGTNSLLIIKKQT